MLAFPAMIVIGFTEGDLLYPLGLDWLLPALLIASLIALRLAPEYLSK
jgi:hypothetical protein